MKNPLMYVVVAIVIAVGAFFLISNNSQQKEVSLSDTNAQNENIENFTEEKSEVGTQQSSTSEVNESSRYLTYTQAGFKAANDKKRVYFFHASWCPTCKAANQEFIENLDKIPSDVILFKTDYDSEKELKKQYAVTYQHTFVYVDKDGKQVKKWNGGAIDELIANTQ